MPEFQVFDIIVLVLAGGLTLRGAMRGLIAQVASVAALVVSWGVAVKFSPILAPMIYDTAPTNKLLAMLILFVATSLVIWLLSGMIDKMISAIKLKKLDRLLGGLVGLIKGTLLCALITFFLVVFSEKTRNFALASVSGRYLAVGIDKVAAIVPEDLSVIVRKNLEGFRASLEDVDLGDLISQQEQKVWDENADGNELGSSLQSAVKTSATNVIKNAVDKAKSELVVSIKDIFGINDEPQIPDSPLQSKVKKAPTEPSSYYDSQDSNAQDSYSQDFGYFQGTPPKEPAHPIEPFRPRSH